MKKAFKDTASTILIDSKDYIRSFPAENIPFEARLTSVGLTIHVFSLVTCNSYELYQKKVLAGSKPFSEITETFFIDDVFYASIEEYIHDLAETFLPENFDENFLQIVNGSKLEPIIKLNLEGLSEQLFDCNEERYGEDPDERIKEIEKALSTIDFKKINEKMPKMWYATKDTYLITAADIEEDLKIEWGLVDF